MNYKDKTEQVLYNLKHQRKSEIPHIIPVTRDRKQIAQLRVITKKDLQDDNIIKLLMKWRKDNQHAFPSQFKVTFEGTKKWAKAQLLDLPDRILFFLETVDGKPYAHMGLYRFDYRQKSCEIDNVIRGKKVLPGSMTPALQALMKWTYDNLHAEFLTLHVFSDNERAVTLYQRCGFIASEKEPLKKVVEPGVIRFDSINDPTEKADRYYLAMKNERASSNDKFDQLVATAKEVRKLVITMIVNAHASHIASSYSIVEILVYLYEKVLRINPKTPHEPNRDRFILSKGWGVSSVYAMLAIKGFFSKKLLEEYCSDGSKFIGGSTRNGIPGIEATTTSMGHGLPIGVGMAIAAKMQKKKYKVYVIISDGELDEGSTWESILIASHHKLDNLIVIVDYNKWQSFGRIKDIVNLEPLAEKLQACNWNVQEINGHDFKDLEKAFTPKALAGNKPNVIIAHTIKGKGLSSIEDKNEWHYQTPREKEQAEAREKGLL